MDTSYKLGNENVKKLTPDFYLEFILDSKGNFINQWHVLEPNADSKGGYISDSEYYREKYPESKLTDFQR